MPDQIVLNGTTDALIRDVAETARRVSEYRPLPEQVVKRIQDHLLGERVFSSNAIEGNTLDLRETATVLSTGRIIENRRREAIEALSLGNAVRTITDLVRHGAEAHTVEQLFGVHRVILRDTPDEYWGGRFREEGVQITGARYQPPDHTLVPSLVERVLERLRRKDDIPGLFKACWAHWALARIHPFKDGNGRIARLWQDLVLFQDNLTCAIIGPQERREYLNALANADEGRFDELVQLVAQKVSMTFDRYLSALAEDREFAAFIKEVAGEADERLEEKRRLAFQRWSRHMEQLRWEFELCAARISDASRNLRIQLRKYDLIDQTRWENIRSGLPADKTWFFALNFDSTLRRLKYYFYFGKHYWSDLDDERDRAENRVCLLISEDDGTGRGTALDRIEDCPISPREVFIVDDQFVLRRQDRTRGASTYDRGISTLRIAQDFTRDVVLRRLS